MTRRSRATTRATAFSWKHAALFCVFLFPAAGTAHATEHTLREAISIADLDLVKQLLEDGADPNTPYRTQVPPIALARQLGQQKILLYLLQHGANAKYDPRLVWHAANSGDLELLGQALTAGGSVDGLVDGQERQELTEQDVPLLGAIAAGKDDAALELLARGAQLELSTKDGRRPLHFAVSHNRIKVLDALLAAGADSNSQDRRGLTPLHLAAQQGNLVAVTTLLRSGADAHLLSKDGMTPLHAAVLGNTDTRILDAFLKRGVDVNSKVGLNHYPWGGATPLILAASLGNVEAIKALLARGADVNAQDARGLTALHQAIARNRPGVDVLFQAGADGAIKDNLGRTAIEDGLQRQYAGLGEFLSNRGFSP